MKVKFSLKVNVFDPHTDKEIVFSTLSHADKIAIQKYGLDWLEEVIPEISDNGETILFRHCSCSLGTSNIINCVSLVDDNIDLEDLARELDNTLDDGELSPLMHNIQFDSKYYNVLLNVDSLPHK